MKKEGRDDAAAACACARPAIVIVDACLLLWSGRIRLGRNNFEAGSRREDGWNEGRGIVVSLWVGLMQFGGISGRLKCLVELRLG